MDYRAVPTWSINQSVTAVMNRGVKWRREKKETDTLGENRSQQTVGPDTAPK